MALLLGESGFWQARTNILLGDPALQICGYKLNTELPDLYVPAPEIDFDFFGQTLTVGVSNNGRHDASGVEIEVYVVDRGTGERHYVAGHVFDLISAKATLTATMDDIHMPRKGHYELSVVADPYDKIEESCESNNINGRRLLLSPLFIDVTEGSGVVFPDHTTVRQADFNNDGYPDIYVSGGTGRLFLNNGDGAITFIDITEVSGVSHEAVADAALGDINNDCHTSPGDIQCLALGFS